MPGAVSLVGDDFMITTAHVAEIKEMGARWDARHNAWKLPATRMNAQLVSDAALGLGDLRVVLAPLERDLEDPRLYDYQRRAAGRLADSKHGLMTVVSPGLGKTAIAITAADESVPDDQIVVVAPAPLLRTWEREIAKWGKVPGKVYVVSGKLDHGLATEARWIIISWDKLARDPDIWGKGWPLFILDESVLTKSRQSKRFKALVKIRRGVARYWLLSGSPTTRYADDLWAQLHLIWPRAFSSYWRFAERYTVVEETPWARVVSATRPGRDAAKDNDDFILVISQEDVLDLPEYLFEAIDVDLTGKQLKAYNDMQKDFIAELSNGTEVIADNEIARLMKLQQIASYWDGSSAKHDALLGLLETYEPPYLIWTHWRAGAEALFARMSAEGKSVELVYGGQPRAAQDRAIEDYKAGDTETLILSLGVGKFGHTLTNTRTIFYLDKTWSADDYFQSLHRVRRIGLKHRPVVVSVRAPFTADALVEANLEGKLGGISRMTKSDLANLLKGLGR